MWIYFFKCKCDNFFFHFFDTYWSHIFFYSVVIINVKSAQRPDIILCIFVFFFANFFKCIFDRTEGGEMLTCITCSKQVDEGGDEGVRGTPSTKEAVKSLTAQVLILCYSPLPYILSIFRFYFKSLFYFFFSFISLVDEKQTQPHCDMQCLGWAPHPPMSQMYTQKCLLVS